MALVSCWGQWPPFSTLLCLSSAAPAVRDIMVVCLYISLHPPRPAWLLLSVCCLAYDIWANNCSFLCYLCDYKQRNTWHEKQHPANSHREKVIKSQSHSCCKQHMTHRPLLISRNLIKQFNSKCSHVKSRYTPWSIKNRTLHNRW